MEYFFALKARRETSCWIKIFGKKCIETKLYKVNKLYSKLKNGDYPMIFNIFAAAPVSHERSLKLVYISAGWLVSYLLALSGVYRRQDFWL